jgi:predicted ATPase
VAKEVERSAFLRSLSLRSGSPQAGYPFELPAITTMGTLRFGEVTIFVGQNGTGKSTLIEALAVAAGLNAEGGSNNLRFETMATHSDLADHLALQWIRRPRWGWFLRAETFSRCAYDDLTVVDLWRRFLTAPERILDNLFTDE